MSFANSVVDTVVGGHRVLLYARNVSEEQQIEVKSINYRGVEQSGSRRAHNPKVEGSNPSSATI